MTRHVLYYSFLHEMYKYSERSPCQVLRGRHLAMRLARYWRAVWHPLGVPSVICRELVEPQLLQDEGRDEESKIPLAVLACYWNLVL